MRFQDIKHSYEGYPIDAWDALQILEELPVVRGSHAYAVAYRSTIGDIYEWLRNQCVDKHGELVTLPFPILRGDLLARCKNAALVNVHLITAAPVGSIERERAQAQADAYADAHDLFREEL